MYVWDTASKNNQYKKFKPRVSLYMKQTLICEPCKFKKEGTFLQDTMVQGKDFHFSGKK
jgi:hypothetical protein